MSFSAKSIHPLLRIAAVAAAIAYPGGTVAHDELPAHHKVLPSNATAVMKAVWLDQQAAEDLDPITGEAAAAANVCSGGFAGVYPCSGVDLLSFLPLSAIGGTRSNSSGNDIWGWTAPDGSEYAIMGRVFGTSFVDISDPVNPVYLGDLPTHGAFGSSWRDVKVYQDHAFIVSEARNHGMQVFDLTQLETMDRSSLPVTFAETAHYNQAAASHNVFINEDSGFAYMVGNSGKNSCSGGLHMVDISDPANPSFAGCYSGDGYTHDVQCVIYEGPDTVYAGNEICFASNEDTLTIVDVTDKSSPTLISRTTYSGSAYTHQGWLTGDQSHFVVDDELDEQSFGHNTRTRVFDVSLLGAPTLAASYDGVTPAIDHNQYMLGSCAIQANYRSGLRIVNIDDLSSISEVGFFDIYPANDNPQFNGMWSNYPYFASGVIVASGMEQGLFVLRPSIDMASICNIPPPGNTAPVVTITNPPDGSSFPDGTFITFTGTVADIEDDPDPAIIWNSSVNGDFGTGSPFSTSLSIGTHTITARATDTGGLTGTDAIVVTVTPTGGPEDIHVQSLTGAVIATSKNRYTGEVLIEIRDNLGGAVSGATVSGSWSGAAKGSSSCATGVAGNCAVSKSGKKGQSMTYSVTGVSHGSLPHDPADDVETSETIASP